MFLISRFRPYSMDSHTRGSSFQPSQQACTINLSKPNIFLSVPLSLIQHKILKSRVYVLFHSRAFWQICYHWIIPVHWTQSIFNALMKKEKFCLKKWCQPKLNFDALQFRAIICISDMKYVCVSKQNEIHISSFQAIVDNFRTPLLRHYSPQAVRLFLFQKEAKI